MTLVSTSKVNFRVAVGTPDGPRSAIWRGFSTKNEVYVCHGGVGGVEKFSLHSSGICRLAFTKEEGPAEGENDRVIARWARISAPATNSIVYGLIARFPTDYLSTALAPEPKKVTWIPPAQSGLVTALHFVFSRTSADMLEEMLTSSGHTLISYTVLGNGEAFIVSAAHQDWIGGEDFTIPGALDPKKEYVISTEDPDGTGRPARFTRYENPNEQWSMMIASEFGAYPVPLGTKFSKPMGTFRRDKILKSSRKPGS
jgi:hypothetical protein